MQGYCDVYKWTILKRASLEVKCLLLTLSRRKMCTLSFSNVIFHKFSHGAAFYTLNGKNVNVMLESFVRCKGESISNHPNLFPVETQLFCFDVIALLCDAIRPTVFKCHHPRIEKVRVLSVDPLSSAVFMTSLLNRK